jgi:hypothetical protein
MVKTPVGGDRLRQKCLDFLSQLGIAHAHGVEKSPALTDRPLVGRVIQLFDSMQAI